ncbi:MAG: YceI family protein [Paracoccaceae bacterium]
MILKNLLLVSYTFAVFTSVLLSSSLLAKETYTIRSSEKLNFNYFISGVPISGEFYIKNTSFTIDFNKEEQSRFYIKIDIKKSSAGFPLATKAMLGSSVLNSEKFPFMEFSSTNISKNGMRYEIKGLLNLRGLKKNVTILVIGAKDNKRGAKILKFGIKSSINRYEFGANGYSLLVGKEIKLNSNISLIKKE